MSLTLKQVSDIVRAKVGELDSQKIEKGILDLDINFAQRRVQQDLMALMGMKTFTKEAVMYGATPAIPTDLIMTNDSIIKIKAGIGVKASGALTGGTAETAYSISITALKAGSIWNYTLALVDDEQVSTPTVSLSGTIIYVTYGMSGSPATCTAIVSALNNSTLVNSDFIFATTTGSITIIEQNSITLTTGANPATYYPCREMTIEEYVEIPNNTYLAPSATAPQFVRRGDTSAIQTIEFLPSTINYSVIYYRYKLADLTTDASTLSVPTEYEEMVIDKTMAKVYEKLQMNELSAEKQIEYAKKVKEYEQSYVTSRNMLLGEKQRLQSNDANN
jgi:hypothetical protein